MRDVIRTAVYLNSKSRTTVVGHKQVPKEWGGIDKSLGLDSSYLKGSVWHGINNY